VTRSEVARRRLSNERLIGRPFTAPVEAVRWLGAVQAQDYAGAKWAIGQRVRGATDASVEAAFDRGDILRTHVLRPTWHAVAPEDIRWMLALTAPRVKAAMAYYDRQLELDAATYARCNDALANALAGGKHRTREELGVALGRAGVAASHQRLGHIMMGAELDAVICSGARRGKQFTYALLDERAPAARPIARDAAVAELARRYFTSHGPAQLADFAWWSGLTVADAKAGVAAASPALADVVVDGKRHWYAANASTTKPPGRAAKPVAHLLPNYDEYLVAYKDHGAAVDPAIGRKVGARDIVFANHVVVLDGQVVGGWRRTVGSAGVVVALKLLSKLSRDQKAALALAVERYRRFLGLPVTLAS
jgi:hypothetical protein